MVTAILVAAGVGKRFGPNTDKLFLEVSGRPVVGHTWARFDGMAEIDEVILVVRAGMEAAFEEIAATLSLGKPWRLVAGGAERQDSVWNGLQAVGAECELVAIQDGARPCTSPEVVRATLDAARESGAAVAAQRVTDTIKQSTDGQWIERTVDRSVLWSVQTPQSFRKEVILKALGEVRRRGAAVTDDTAACELIGQRVRLVESRLPNPKVTYPGDLPWIEVVLGREVR
jgi:2-C-methyl-D-erythritol 4-phosphate cytidylyltransferase